MNLQVIGVATPREANVLAMSSRNNLKPQQRLGAIFNISVKLVIADSINTVAGIFRY